MPAAELLAADDHLSACETCRRRLGRAAEAREVLTALREDLRRAAADEEHLAYEQFAAYADGELDGAGRAAVEAHAGACNQCASELRELLALKETLEARPATPAPVRPAEPAPRAGFVERLFGGFRSIGWAWSPRFALAATVLFAVAVGLWLVTKTRKGPAPEVAQQTLTPTPAPTPAPKATPGADGPQASPQQPQNERGEDAPEALVALEDGGRRVTLERGGGLQGLEALTPSQREQVRKALTTRKLEAPSLADVRSEARTLLGGAEESFDLSGPAGVVVREDRPVFRWRPLAGAEGYTVRVYDDNFKEVAASPRVTANEWRPSGPLARGRVYTWQVKAQKGGAEVLAPAPPAPEARFRVLGRAQAEELSRAERSVPRSHLTLGVLYARAGLLEEAERHLSTLVRQNPRSEAARELLREVRSLRKRR
jgi:hypothetical protein